MSMTSFVKRQGERNQATTAGGGARVQYPFNKIISLYNDNATRDNILKTLGDLKSQTAESDGVFIFFAGHGNTVKRVAVRKPAIYCPTTALSNRPMPIEIWLCPSCAIKCRKSRPTLLYYPYFLNFVTQRNHSQRHKMKNVKQFLTCCKLGRGRMNVRNVPLANRKLLTDC